MSFTYYVIKNEDLYGKLKNDGNMIDYVYGPEPSKIWWRNLWTAPKNLNFSDLGKLIWITGPPGTGKSTTAQCLARDHGYVYYEADCFASLKESRNMWR